MNLFNTVSKNLNEKRRGIFLLSFIASFSFTLILFEYAQFQKLLPNQVLGQLQEDDFSIEEDQIKNIIFDLPAVAKKRTQSTRIEIVEEIPRQRSQIESIEKVSISSTSLPTFKSNKAKNSQLKIPKKRTVHGFADINLSNFPFFKDCQNETDPVEQYKCTQHSITQFLLRNTHYPKIPRELGIEGTVVVSFIIDTKGMIQEPVILRTVDRQIDSEALRVIKNLPKFEAGRVKGRAINVRFEVPIHFKLAKK